MCGRRLISHMFASSVGVDAVGEIVQDSFGLHAERRGHEFGVHAVDEVDQAGSAQHAGRDLGRGEQLADVVGRCRGLPGSADPGDDDVWVMGVLLVSVVEAVLRHRPGRWVQRHGVGAPPEPDRAHRRRSPSRENGR